MTDGFSNGGSPRNLAKALKLDGVTIFTFGVQTGNIEELFEMASTPAEEHCYILNSFEEFVALARRALHRGRPTMFVNITSLVRAYLFIQEVIDL